MKPKVFVTGANGLIGQQVAQTLQRSNQFQCLFSGKGKCRVPEISLNYFPIDLLNEKLVESTLKKFNPNFIIHLAAISHVDVCEKDPILCEKINVNSTKQIGALAKKLNAKLIFFSSDFVFEGKSPLYRINDIPKPVSVYGKSKLEAENWLRANLISYTIIRPILVFGVGKGLSRNNMFTWVIKSLSEGKSITVVQDQFRSPTYVQDVANATLEILLNPKNGIIHLCGPEHLSVYEFSIRIAQVCFPDKLSLISPILTAQLNELGKRPPITGFDLTETKTLFDFNPISIEKAVKQSYKKHSQLI